MGLLTPQPSDDQGEAARPPEVDAVNNYRFDRLVEAGCPFWVANLIASSKADLHKVVEMLANGCSPELAVEIVT
jgi:hypothetical protein